MIISTEQSIESRPGHCSEDSVLTTSRFRTVASYSSMPGNLPAAIDPACQQLRLQMAPAFGTVADHFDATVKRIVHSHRGQHAIGQIEGHHAFVGDEHRLEAQGVDTL